MSDGEGRTHRPAQELEARATGTPGGPRRALWCGLIGLAWLVLVVLSVRVGPSGAHPLAETLRGSLAVFGLAEPLEAAQQTIVRLRLWRALTAGGVGAGLALAGACLQGLFRNGLASPAVVGVTAGSVFGASLAIAFLGGFGPGLAAASGTALAPLLVTGAAFVGATGASFLVLSLATTGGRLSVPALLLAGIAVNTLVAGLLAALQSATLEDYEVSRAMLSWTFGTLDDRAGWQVALVWCSLGLSALVIPFVAVELDLFAGGEEDALALGVATQRVKVVTLLAAALATAAAVSVAGQIAFGGLGVPHLVRRLVGRSHRILLPLSLGVGACFLLGCDVLQRWFFPDVELRPGVTMSLIGGPMFLVLLVRARRGVLAW